MKGTGNELRPPVASGVFKGCLNIFGHVWQRLDVFGNHRYSSKVAGPFPKIPVMMEGKSQAFGPEKVGRLYFKTILISDGRYRKFVML